MEKIKKSTSKLKKRSSHVNVRPITEAVLTAFIAIALIFLSTYLVHVKSMESLEEEIKIGLKSNVKSASTRINGDFHALFTDQTSRQDSLYLSQTEPLEEIRQKSKDIRYLYTNILVNDTVYFVLNPSPQNDNDGDGVPDLAPALMNPYNDPSPALLKALKEQKATVSDTYEDEWGIFVSAYAPFYNSKGEFVGTLGMDLELNNFYERLEPIKIAFEKTVIIIIFIGLVIGLFIWYIRKQTKKLISTTNKHQLEIKGMNNTLQDAFLENISLLSKIKKTLERSSEMKSQLPEKFFPWMKQAIQYQQSKVELEKPNLVDFELFNFIETLKEQNQDVNLKIVNQIKIHLKVCGAPVSIYVNAISTFIDYLARGHKREDLIELKLYQKEEGIHDMILHLEIVSNQEENLDNELIKVSQPDAEISTANFNIPIAINELSRYDSIVETYNNSKENGILIRMKFFKSKDRS